MNRALPYNVTPVPEAARPRLSRRAWAGLTLLALTLLLVFGSFVWLRGKHPDVGGERPPMPVPR
jgi:hypothetical protein